MTRLRLLWLPGLVAGVVTACSSPVEQTGGSNSNWLEVCETHDDCKAGSCQCGLCTESCSAGRPCDVPDTECIAVAKSRSRCAGKPTAADFVCLPRTRSAMPDVRTPDAAPSRDAELSDQSAPPSERDTMAADTDERDIARQGDAGTPQPDRRDASVQVDASATKPRETCFDLRAHGAQESGDTSPYRSMTGEYLVSFYFDVPYDQALQATRFVPLVDDPENIHHIFLLDSSAKGRLGGTYEMTIGLQRDAQLLFAWFPGIGEFALPPDVGAYLPAPGGLLEIEIEYVRPGEAKLDRSGMRVCAISEPLPHLATLSLLGTETVPVESGQSAIITGACLPTENQGATVELVAAVPHMHNAGRRIAATVERAEGGTDVLLDTLFDPVRHRVYETPYMLHPGDRILTRCTYQNDHDRAIRYGPSVSDEMCYDFVYAYPPNALANPFSASILGVRNACVGPAEEGQ